MNRVVEFTVSTVPGQHIDRNLATDAIAKALGNLGYMVDITHKDCTAAVAAAVAAEREACAEVADDHGDMENSHNAMSVARESMALAIAEVIRARASGGNGGGEEGC